MNGHRRAFWRGMPRLGIVLMAMALATGSVGQADVIAYRVPAGTAGNQAFGGPLGMEFDVNVPVVLTEMGVFDDGSDGLSRPITASLYDRTATGSPMVTLPFATGTGAPLVGGSRFQPLAGPLLLRPGFQGTIVAENYGGSERNGNSHGGPPAWTTDSGGGAISFVGGARWGATQGSYPPNADGGPANRYAAGTFAFQRLVHSIEPIAVPNASFEMPALADDAWTNALPGWTPSSGSNAGNWNPPPGKFLDPVPDGQQVAFINGAALVSDPLPENLAADTLYILRADMGDRLDHAPPRYSMALRAGGTTLGWANNGNIFNIDPPADGRFAEGTLYATANHNASLGAPLDIVLSKGGGGQAVFDNVRLTKIPAAAMPVGNFSFEADDVTPNGGWQDGATGWSPGGAGGGVFEHASLIGAADGEQCAFIRAGGSMTHVLEGIDLVPEYRYILLADVGNRSNIAYAGYALELLAGDEVVASVTNPVGGGDDVTIQGGFYLTAVLDHQVPWDHPLAGQDLAIRLSAPSVAAGGTHHTYYDNVRLFAVRVPEPTTLALVGLGALALGRRRRH